MSKKKESPEEEADLNNAYALGRCAGLEEAGNLLLERAVEEFRNAATS